MTSNACRSIVGVITVLLALISSAFAQVVINEVHYHPATAAVLQGEDPARLEFVELYNSGAAAVDLSGWSIGSAVQFTFPGGTLLASDAYIVVARDPALLKARWPAIPPGVQVLGWKSGELSAGVVQLVDAVRPLSATVDQVAYSDKGLWPSAPAGSGPSLELLSAKLDNTNPRAWRASTDVNGTPGTRNSRASDGPIVIDESPLRGTSLGAGTEISVTFSEAVKGVVASDLVVDGMPAKTVTGSGAGPYVFAIDTPKSGHIPVTLNGGGISSISGPSFSGDAWFFDNPPKTLMSMPDTAVGGPGTDVEVEISATPEALSPDSYGFDMTITYNPAVLQLATTSPVTVAGVAVGLGFDLAYGNDATNGILTISEFSARAPLVSPGGVIAKIKFHVIGGYGEFSALHFTKVVIDEDLPPPPRATLDDGLLTVDCTGAENGTACDDRNACTQTDTCVNGLCVGGNPVSCDDNNPCTENSCNTSDGSCSYPAGNSGTECRPSAGQCDVAESCTGASGACPANGFQPNTTSCVGTSNGDTCDGTDSCNGSGACVDGYLAATTECRASAGQCDVAESCTGTSGACPADAKSTAVCRPSAGACDVAESCDGVANTCPLNLYSCAVTGNVVYYRDDLANGGLGGEPSTKPVSGVGINLTGFATVPNTSDVAGAYGFANLYGNVTITAAELWGGARATNTPNVIGSLDASAIARAAVLLVNLTANQRTAGDVTGDHTISAFDASYVARFAALLLDRFPVATRNGAHSDWAFVPLAYTYSPIGASWTAQNFSAILYGDVTGNWSGPAPFAGFGSGSSTAKPADEIAADQELAALLANRPTLHPFRGGNAGSAVLSMNGSAGVLRAGERRQVTISLQNADGILGLDLSLGYDASRIRIVDVAGTGLGTSFIWAKAGQGETYRVAGYGIDPLSGSGPVLTVTIEALRNGGVPNLLSVQASANEGAIPLEVRAVGKKLLLSN